MLKAITAEIKKILNRFYSKQPAYIGDTSVPVINIAKDCTDNQCNNKEVMPNPWWQYLVANSCKTIFIQPGDEAKRACNEIRDMYAPILHEYGVESGEFFLGSIKKEDAEALYALVRQRKPDIVYQVGTFVGYSAMVLAHAINANGKGRLIAVDPEIPHRTFINPVDVARKAASVMGLDGQIEFVRGCHSISLGDFIGHKLSRTVPVVGKSVLENLGCEVDFAFIDGDHSVSATICDFMLIKDYLKIGGVAVFHDVYSWPSVAHALKIILEDNYYYVNGTEAYFSFDTRQGWDGLGAMSHTKRPMMPMLKVDIISEKDGRPVPCATVSIRSLGIDARTDNNGSAYIYNSILPDTKIEIFAKGYTPCLYRTQNLNSEDYEEIRVEITQTLEDLQNEHCLEEPTVGYLEIKEANMGYQPLIRCASRKTNNGSLLYCSGDNNITIEGVNCVQFKIQSPIIFKYRCPFSGFSAVECVIGTYKRKNSGNLSLKIFQITDNKEYLIRQTEIPCDTLKDNSFATFDFQPVVNSKNKLYYICFELINTEDLLHPGLWYGVFK